MIGFSEVLGFGPGIREAVTGRFGVGRFGGSPSSSLETRLIYSPDPGSILTSKSSSEIC